MDETIWADPFGLGRDIKLYERQVTESGIGTTTAAYSRLIGYATRARAAYGEGDFDTVREELKAGRAEIQSQQDEPRVPVSVAHAARVVAVPGPSRPARRRSQRMVALITAIITLAVIVGLAVGGSAIHLFNPAPGPTMSMTESQVISAAGLPPEYGFTVGLIDNMTVSDLDPDMVLWTDPAYLGTENGHTVIQADAYADTRDGPDYGPLGRDQLLVFKRGNTLEGVYFPDACGWPRARGKGPTSGKVIPIEIVRTVFNTCG